MKNMLKKMTLGFLGLFGIVTLSYAALGVNSVNAAGSDSSSDFNAAGFNINAGESSETGVVGAGQDKKRGLIDVIKSAINWILGMLSLITLVILLWGGFQMVTAAGDDGKYKKGFTILKQAGIGLAFIGLSWFVVSIIFWLIGGVAGTTGA